MNLRYIGKLKNGFLLITTKNEMIVQNNHFFGQLTLPDDKSLIKAASNDNSDLIVVIV